MRKFTRLTAIAAPLVRPNIDTDALIPGHQLTFIAKSGFARGLFCDWRFENPKDSDEARRENPDFVLNRAPYREAKILLAGGNFACGSSREAAVWALRDWGIRCIIAPSYGPIFYASCFKNGLLPVVLAQEIVDALAAEVEASNGAQPLTVDLATCAVTTASGRDYPFSVATNLRRMLLEGLDHIDATLTLRAAIESFETRDRSKRPWVHARERPESAAP